MQLHYIWIKKFKNIHDQGFSFSSKYMINYNQENEKLDIIANPRYIDNFFPGNITSVTGIVGANGAGKSNLFEFIKYILASFSAGSGTVFNGLNGIVVFDKYICVHIDLPLGNQDKLVKLGFEVLRFKESLAYPVESAEDLDPGFLDDNHPIYENAYIFYSNIFDNRYESHLFELMDISTNHLIATDVNDNRYNNYDSIFLRRSEIDSISAYGIMETERQLDFLASKGHSLPFNLPSSVIIRIEHAHNKYLEHYSSSLKEHGLTAFNDIWHMSWGNLNTEDSDELKQIYRRMLVYKLMIILQLREPSAFTNVTDLQFMDIIFNDKYEVFEQIYVEDKLTRITEFLAALDSILNVSSARKRDGKQDSNFEFHDIIETPLNDNTLPLLLDFFIKYNKVVGTFTFLAFHWEGLSSGEQAIFNIYARFHYAFQYHIVGKAKHVIIMLDEAETSLHPAWQSKLLNDLLIYFNTCLPKKTIQLIVTSHSPFLVSDLPKTMINFLDKDEQGNCVVVDGLSELKNTFGANINTLYSDSFFMKQTLMGDFARNKIDRLINIVNRQKDFDEEFPNWDIVQQYIDLIGEPLLKGFLQKQLNYNLIVSQKDVSRLREEVKKLEDRIKKIENQNDTN